MFDVVRARPAAPGLRAGGEGEEMPTMVGHFASFDEWYEIHSYWEGDFIERIRPGAFEESFAEHWDSAASHRTKVQFQHGWDPRVGNQLLGSISTLREDTVGGYYEVPLFDTSYNRDLLPGLAAGEYGASFRSRVLTEEWDEKPGVSGHNPKGLPERSITRSTVFELGPVAFGASPTATAGLRSLTDAYYEAMSTAQPAEYAQVCRSAGRSPGGRRVDDVEMAAAEARAAVSAAKYATSGPPVDGTQARLRRLGLDQVSLAEARRLRTEIH